MHLVLWGIRSSQPTITTKEKEASYSPKLHNFAILWKKRHVLILHMGSFNFRHFENFIIYEYNAKVNESILCWK